MIQTLENNDQNVVLGLDKIEIAKEMCEALFDESKRDIKVNDIPFQGWSCTEVVLFLLDDLEDKVTHSLQSAKKNSIVLICIFVVGTCCDKEKDTRSNQKMAP